MYGSPNSPLHIPPTRADHLSHGLTQLPRHILSCPRLLSYDTSCCSLARYLRATSWAHYPVPPLCHLKPKIRHSVAMAIPIWVILSPGIVQSASILALALTYRYLNTSAHHHITDSPTASQPVIRQTHILLVVSKQPLLKPRCQSRDLQQPPSHYIS